MLKNKLKLDFTQLNRPKRKHPMEFIVNDQKPAKETKLQKEKEKVQLKFKMPPALQLNNIREEDEKSVGFHEEFMSKIDEFSESWRKAAMNERKIP